MGPARRHHTARVRPLARRPLAAMSCSGLCALPAPYRTSRHPAATSSAVLERRRHRLPRRNGTPAPPLLLRAGRPRIRAGCRPRHQPRLYRKMDPRFASSIAATGFGLTALCIADSRSYLPADPIRLACPRNAAGLLEYAQRAWILLPLQRRKDRPSSAQHRSLPIDTAILLCGILTCRAYFNDPKISELATQIYDRVDWPWMLNEGRAFSLAGFPATGFLSPAGIIGGDDDAIPSRHRLVRNPDRSLLLGQLLRVPACASAAINFISSHDPLFVHLYSHAWFDFYRKRDAFTDYFNNSVTAVRAHKAFCLSLNRGYSDDYWGVTASDWQHGYATWGGPPLQGPVDGSVVPCATAGSLPFLPAGVYARPSLTQGSVWRQGLGPLRPMRRLPPCGLPGTTPTSSASISASAC